MGKSPAGKKKKEVVLSVSAAILNISHRKQSKRPLSVLDGESESDRGGSLPSERASVRKGGLLDLLSALCQHFALILCLL